MPDLAWNPYDCGPPEERDCSLGCNGCDDTTCDSREEQTEDENATILA